MSDLTIKDAQKLQPWTIPYAYADNDEDTTDLDARHTLFHAMKTVGKIAGVYELSDHIEGGSLHIGEREQTIRDMAADLMSEALRFANLYNFDLETELRRRVAEKNHHAYPE